MQATVEELNDALYTKRKTLYPSRQRFTLPLKPGEKKPIALAPGKKLSDYDLSTGSVLHFKDLGPQVENLPDHNDFFTVALSLTSFLQLCLANSAQRKK